eukprot:ANDGO_00349.mRNA.1 E3 ubiquitin-protein ligase HEL2
MADARIKNHHHSMEPSVQRSGSRDAPTCLVCFENLTVCAVGPCNHANVCYKCSIRMRILQRDTSCCVCKQPIPTALYIPYRDLGAKKWGDLPHNRFPKDKRWKLEAKTRDLLKEVVKFRDAYCPVPGCTHHIDAMVPLPLKSEKALSTKAELGDFACTNSTLDDAERPVDESSPFGPFPNIGVLKRHVREDHGLSFCELCLKHSPKFVCEQHLYTQKELRSHLTVGSGDRKPGVAHGHPYCKFCKTHYYSEDEIFAHMNLQHETCFLCVRSHQLQYVYYENYAALEEHFRACHYMCEDVNCKQMHFIVFPSNLELQSHMASTHGVGGGRSKMSVSASSFSGASRMNPLDPAAPGRAFNLSALARAIPFSFSSPSSSDDSQPSGSNANMSHPPPTYVQSSFPAPSSTSILVPNAHSSGSGNAPASTNRQQRFRQHIDRSTDRPGSDAVSAIGMSLARQADFPSLGTDPDEYSGTSSTFGVYGDHDCMIPRMCGHAPAHPFHSTGNCPPCKTLVPHVCAGGHCELPTMCYLVMSAKRKAEEAGTEEIGIQLCTRACGKPLPCGHSCKKNCHAGRCPPCAARCERPRPDCGHPCSLKCGHVASCSSNGCFVKVIAGCACGHRQETLTCSELRQQGVKAVKVDVEGTPVDDRMNTEELYVLKCTRECRNSAFRDALKLDQDKLVTDEIERPPYTEFLKSFALRNDVFVRGVVDKIRTFVLDPKQPKALDFPAMGIEKRAFLHQLGSYYFLESEAKDAEPKRSVSMYRTEMTSNPPYSLQDAISSKRATEERKEKNMFLFYLVITSTYPGQPISYDVLRKLDSSLRTWYRGKCFLQTRDDDEAHVLFSSESARDDAFSKIKRMGLDLRIEFWNREHVHDSSSSSSSSSGAGAGAGATSSQVPEIAPVPSAAAVDRQAGDGWVVVQKGLAPTSANNGGSTATGAYKSRFAVLQE